MRLSPSQRLLTAALSAAGQGWPVLPLRPYGKRPAIKDWPNRATYDPQRLEFWWGQAPYNVGIACGPAGLLVVDLDCPADPAQPSGRAVFAAMARTAGAWLEPTFRVVTPSGGGHLYYAVGSDQPSRSTAGLLGSNVDTRGAGGYVVAAGSALLVDGRPRYYRIADPVPPTALPAWLADLLRPPPSWAYGPVQLVRSSAYVRTAVAGECERIRTAAPGTRNTTVFQAAVRLGTLVGAEVLDQHTAIGQLRAAASLHCGTGGFTDAEADRTIANGLQYGIRRPRQLRPG